MSESGAPRRRSRTDWEDTWPEPRRHDPDFTRTARDLDRVDRPGRADRRDRVDRPDRADRPGRADRHSGADRPRTPADRGWAADRDRARELWDEPGRSPYRLSAPSRLKVAGADPPTSAWPPAGPRPDPGSSYAAPGGVPGRRTITITGRGAERHLPSSRRRPQRPVHYRPGFRPDRVAMWAVLLGVMLVLVAATSSHAAPLRSHSASLHSHSAPLHAHAAPLHAHAAPLHAHAAPGH